MINTTPTTDLTYMSSGLTPITSNRLPKFNEGLISSKSIYLELNKPLYTDAFVFRNGNLLGTDYIRIFNNTLTFYDSNASGYNCCYWKNSNGLLGM